MKINRGNFTLDITIAGLLYLLAFAAAVWFSHFNGDFYLINWVSLILVIGACCFIRLPFDKSTASKFHTWQIIGLQISLLAIFAGISQFIGPVSLQTMAHYEARLGFFPWATALLIAIICRYLAHRRQADISFLDILMTVLPIQHGSNIWSVTFMYLRQIAMTILAFTLALLTLGLLQQWQPIGTSLTLRHLLISLIPVIFLFYKPLNKQINHFTKRRKFLSVSIPAFAILLAVILTITSGLLSGLSQPAPPPFLIKFFNSAFNPNNIVQFFNHGWWFAWSAMTGIFIAHRARHMSLIRMVLTASAVPLLLLALSQLAPHDAAIYLPSQTIYISLLGCILLCGLLFQKDVLPLFILMYYPFKPTPKPRVFEIHMKRCLKTMCLMCFFAIPIGATAVAYFTCLIGLPLLIALPFMMLSLFSRKLGSFDPAP